MSSDGVEGEFETYRRLIEELYPTGIVSIVSDTYDFWRVVTEYLPRLKDVITKREGKVVVRPDSSPKTPVEIICGDPDAPVGSPEYLGLARCLYNTFGGTVNSKGYIDLHPSVGMIYGDSITLEYQEAILKGLMDLGFSSTNIVLGIGSYTYQMVTRDTHGIAIKATCVKIDGEYRPIYKDPKTDNSGKKSARGLLGVLWDGSRGEYILTQDEASDIWEDPTNSCLRRVFVDGDFIVNWTFDEIRANLVKSWNGERI
jgi:nicotinamide phosphoribosyltransferase